MPLRASVVLLLLACCLGLAHAARVAGLDERSAIKPVATVRQGRDIELQDDAWALAFGGLKDGEHGHVNMSLYCNEDRVCPHKMLNSSEPYSCWGTFRLFGKWVDEDDHVRAMWGGKCEGNLRAFRAPGKAIISVCSGLMKQFGARAFDTDDGDDHHHPEMAAVRGSGCNGKHVFGMIREDDDDDDSDDVGYSPLALHEALAAAAGDVVIREPHIEQALREVSDRDRRGPGRAEASCDGKGGMFKGVVELPRCKHARAAVAAIADVDGLEGMVNMSMVHMGVSLFQGAPPAHPTPPPRGEHPFHNTHKDPHDHEEHHKDHHSHVDHHSHEEHHEHEEHHNHEDHHSHEEHDEDDEHHPHEYHHSHEEHHKHEEHHSHFLSKLFQLGDHSTHAPPPMCGPPRMHCQETCNGRQPWIKGLPCWGKFEVYCSKPQDAEAAGKLEEAAGKLEEPVEDGHCGPKKVYASCEGFFSGWLGMTCRGFATKHIVSERKDMRAFCSGKEAILIVKPSFFFHTHSHGFAAFCDGSALSTVAFEGERRAAVAA